MNIRRREFFGTASALVAGFVASKPAGARERPQSGEGAKTPPIPTRPAKVERLYKAPDIHPNALEAAPDGLWKIGRAHV